MMDEKDPRVKKLQELGWGLQNITNKPGCRLPEQAKRASYRVTSRAITLCSNVAYVEEADFLERAAELTREIEAKKVELQEMEAGITKELQGKCFRAAGGGGGDYSVGSKAVAAQLAAAGAPGGSPSGPLATTARGGGPLALTAAEVAARCAEDPEALWLSGLGLRDTDLEAVCEGLRRSGERLTSLDLSHNEIADAGVQRLVTALARGACPRLQELWLSGNPFGDLGVQILAGGLGALRRGLSVHTDSSGAATALRDCGSSGGTQAEPSMGEGGDGRGAAADRTAVGAAAAAVASDTSEAGVAGVCDPHPAHAEPLEAADQQREAPPSTPPPVAGATASSSATWRSPEEVLATVALPGDISSAQEVELDVSAERLVVRRAGGAGDAVADMALPCAVDLASVRAAFSRRRRVMTVTMRPAEPAPRV